RKGIIIADTKLEFGTDPSSGQPTLIDEVLTPDSSRFWPLDRYEPGRSQPSFDKQFVRDYLTSIKWDKQPPAPHLPADVIAQTSARYREAYRLLAEGHDRAVAAAWVSSLIFLVTIAVLLTDWVHRTIVVWVGAAVMLAV